jgi:hypothetical protein
MRTRAYVGAITLGFLSVAGCTVTPGMPPDYALPVAEIIRHAVCELRLALRKIDHSNPSFRPSDWVVQITLTPKVDAEFSARAGLTGRSTTLTQKYFNTWTVGAAPGAQLYAKGHTDGSAAYTIRSSDLLDRQGKLPIDCDREAPRYHALVRNLGIFDWLSRTASAVEGDVAKLARLDKPTYNAQIIIKFDGAGNYTYNFPFGTDFAGLYLGYALDESLSIAFTPAVKAVRVRTLPEAPLSSAVPAVATIEEKSRLDFLQLEQTLRNLQVIPSTR